MSFALSPAEVREALDEIERLREFLRATPAAWRQGTTEEQDLLERVELELRR